MILGRLAQLVEHLVYTERVKGSSPLSPTMKNPGNKLLGFFFVLFLVIEVDLKLFMFQQLFRWEGGC